MVAVPKSGDGGWHQAISWVKKFRPGIHVCKPIWHDCAASFSCVYNCRCKQKNLRRRKEWLLLGVRCSSSDSTTQEWEEKCSAAAAAARGSFSTLGAGWVGAQGLGSAQYARTRQTATTHPQTLARRK